jgi:drug/metabolite transporter (DMT)-like permease
MVQVILLTLLFDLATGFSIVLTGDRSMISGNLFNHFFQILLNWKFILAMILAVGSRLFFILINNQLLKIPTLAKNSTTITVFITASSYIFIILLNYFFLNERITLQQIIGSIIVVAGVIVIMY